MVLPPPNGHTKSKGQSCGGRMVGEGRAESSLPWPRLNSGPHHTTLLQGRRCQYNFIRKRARMRLSLSVADLVFYIMKLNLDTHILAHVHACRHSNPAPGQAVPGLDGSIAQPSNWEPHQHLIQVLHLLCIMFRPGKRQPQTLALESFANPQHSGAASRASNKSPARGRCTYTT